ncbi:MAG: MotA/TolQ/ExbB proton channel family protein, partial [Bdellovibrionales bacterium]|nr:MotA/TolQ/ExbB proton channel family protein [Bdellovibrionales bacterium]
VDIDAAYKREFIFLKSQIKELKKQKGELTSKMEQAISSAQKDLDHQQKKVVSLNATNEKLGDRLFKLEQNAELETENQTLLSNTVKQAALSLEVPVKTEQDLSLYFDQALLRLENSSKIRQAKGAFYLESGQQVEGNLLQIGNIATIGEHDRRFYMLAPAGEGALKAWKGIAEGAALFKGEFPAVIPLFIYEGLEKAVHRKPEQTLFEFVQAGGSIAWVIVLLGLFGLVLCLLRAWSLRKYAAEANYIDEHCHPSDLEGTKKSLEEMNSKSTQRNLFLKILNLRQRGKENIHDVVDEGMIQEHKFIDRFGSLILVFAAVAPLLGLLGTVTGMISTFDIITEHGTGDPKLLSHGISEALITTELGLIVAIPTLLFGNILSGWGKNLKMTLDKVVLKLTNETES